MIRNGSSLIPLNLQLFAEPGDGAGADGGADDAGTAGGAGGDDFSGGASGNGAGAAGEGNKQGDDANKGENTIEALNAKIARLEAEAAKQKNALDKATKEAGEARKALKAKMTQEEIDAANKKEAEEKSAKELEDLKREVAKGRTVKTIMGKLGLDEDSAGNLADHLFGAADIENAMLEIQKAWQAKETALRKEYGKIPGPGAGTDSNSPEALAVKRAADIGKAKNAQNEQAQKALNAYLR